MSNLNDPVGMFIDLYEAKELLSEMAHVLDEVKDGFKMQEPAERVLQKYYKWSQKQSDD